MFSAVSSVFNDIPIYTANPLALLLIFIATNFVMVWRLHAMESKGFEGTVLGTLIMPYCSGFANLVFAFTMSSSAANGRMVIENCLVNNTTNLTLIMGLAAVLGGKAVARPKTKKHAEFQRINRLNLLFTLIALFLFTGTLWALAKDKVLNRYDGLVLVGLFLFWQVLHVFEILKDNIRKNKSFQWSLVIDLGLIAASAYGIYYSVGNLVEWVTRAENQYVSFQNLGWLSGMLMVLPNAFLALYYTHVGRQDIVMSSQIGDGHICIPMCIGLFLIFNPIQVPDFFQTGITILFGAAALHFIFIALLGRIPRLAGLGLVGGYGYFLYSGLVG